MNNVYRILIIGLWLSVLNLNAVDVIAATTDLSKCPLPSNSVSDQLEKLHGRAVPDSASEAVRTGTFRLLTARGDEAACRALYLNGHEEYIAKTWSDLIGYADDQLVYDAAYYEAGDYYIAIFLLTPTPQEPNSSEIRAYLGDSFLMIYDEKFKEVFRMRL
jgi:hypothetical protein